MPEGHERVATVTQSVDNHQADIPVLGKTYDLGGLPPAAHLLGDGLVEDGAVLAPSSGARGSKLLHSARPGVDSGVSFTRQRQHQEMHFVTPEQVNDLVASIEDRYRALIFTAAYARLRAGELVALRVGSPDLGEPGGTIAVTGVPERFEGSSFSVRPRLGGTEMWESPASYRRCSKTIASGTRPRMDSCSAPARAPRFGIGPRRGTLPPSGDESPDHRNRTGPSGRGDP